MQEEDGWNHLEEGNDHDDDVDDEKLEGLGRIIRKWRRSLICSRSSRD